MLERSKTKTEEHEENDMTALSTDATETGEDLEKALAEAMRPRVPSGAIIRFDRNVMGQTFTYAAIYAGGVWYVTGSLKSRRTFRQDEFVSILAEDETSDIAVAETWTQLIV